MEIEHTYNQGFGLVQRIGDFDFIVSSGGAFRLSLYLEK